MASKLFDEIVGVLTPGVGEHMARVSVEMHLAKVGIDHDSLGPQHLHELVRAIQPGLAVFVGKADAGELAERLLGLLPASRNGG